MGSMQAVFVSPLQRARQTALALFGDGGEGEAFRPPEGKLWFELKVLKEKRAKEYAQHYLSMSDSIYTERVRIFVQFLQLLPFERFVLVGHSHFFRSVFR